MGFVLRDYQEQASRAAVNAFNNKNSNGILVLPTGAGKSLVIADIAAKLGTYLLVFQPSKEILEQNFKKFCSYGIKDCGIYSASVGMKEIRKVTFATIGSVKNHIDDFRLFKYVIVDECHLVNSLGGMYKDFIDAEKRQVIGLTATPYRLYTNSLGSQLRFITRTRPRVFTEVLYHCQIGDLLAKGFLAKMNYYDLTRIDLSRVKENSTHNDYRDDSLEEEYQRSDFYGYLVEVVNRLLHPKSGIPRRGILVFTRFVREAERLICDVPNSAIVTGETPKAERESILERFKSGEIDVVANVGTLTTGFDYPELDTIVMARPTKSLSLWYQCVGRAIRPHKDKESWVVDLCGNITRFGKVEDLKVEKADHGKWCVTSRGRQLTNITIL